MSGLARLGCVVLSSLAACAVSTPRFPLAQPMARDTDLVARKLPCHRDEQGQKTCTPQPYFSPLAWDGADNMVFRPLSDTLAVEAQSEAINVNSMDEVPDSAWFTSRLGAGAFDAADLGLGACKPEQILDPRAFEPGDWLIDQGKGNGASPGFRVRLPDKTKYLFKSDEPVPERPSAASVIGAAAYHAVGFFTSCEQVVYFDPALLKLKPDLKGEANFGGEKRFDRAALDALLAKLPRRGTLVRMQASAWLPGKTLGPFRYEGVRGDDPNDVVPHQHRRELRGGRLLAAWLNHFDAREQNTMDVWAADGETPEAPGRVIHYYLDTSDSLGSEWAWDGISRRLGHSYVFDADDIAFDFITLGAVRRPWERVQRTPGQEMFGYYDVRHFEPDAWKMEYPNAAFSRMTERDGAWMARILARFTPQMVRDLARLGQFSNARHTEYLTQVLEGRLGRILSRYLTRLLPVTSLQIEHGRELCGLDLARWRGLRPEQEYAYSAQLVGGTPLAVRIEAAGRLCVSLPEPRADRALPPDAPERYRMLSITSNRAQRELVVHLYDEGTQRGYALVGLEREPWSGR